jgi:hypothetical protein
MLKTLRIYRIHFESYTDIFIMDEFVPPSCENLEEVIRSLERDLKAAQTKKTDDELKIR